MLKFRIKHFSTYKYIEIKNVIFDSVMPLTVSKVAPVSCHEDGWEVEVQFREFLTLVLDAGEWPASRHCHLTPEKESLVPLGYETGWAPELV
jgi:hypothetical protein